MGARGTTKRTHEDAFWVFDVIFARAKNNSAIAHILGTLDDKIELNRRMNETLEAMARALFKSWFVDFDPVRAKAEGRDPGLPMHVAELFPNSFEEFVGQQEVPRSWSFGKVGDFVDLQRDLVNPFGRPDEIFSHYSIPAFDNGRRPVKEKGEGIKSSKIVVTAEARSGLQTQSRNRPYLAPRCLGRVDKLNPDSDAGKQHEGGEALDQLVVAGGDTA